MLEYTNAFLKAFPWARAAYSYTLGLSQDPQMTVNQQMMTANLFDYVSTTTDPIKTSTDWNFHSSSILADLGGLYETLDQADTYINSLYNIVNSRLSESEKRLISLETSLRTIRTVNRSVATTAIHIKGGERDWIETNPIYYKTIGPLESIPEEGIFRLADTGHFSSIRSLGGFPGLVEIERSLGQIQEQGSLRSIVDGSRATFWTGMVYAPAPVRADQNDIPWLPSEYRHGAAMMITYYLDRPTLASEVFIDPITTEPFDLVSVSWTPLSVDNTLSCGGFEDTPCPWTFTDSASRLSGVGRNSSFGLMVTQASGYASYTFVVSGAQAGPASGGELIGHRAQLTYNLRGIGVSLAGARLVWMNASGAVISYKMDMNYPPGFFTNYKLVDIIPPGTVSGRVDLGIFNTTTQGSAFFDDAVLLLGEQTWYPSIRIDKPTSVPLPIPALSGRFSFVFAQRNPRREMLILEDTGAPILGTSNNGEVDPSLQRSTQVLGARASYRGPGTPTFAYRIGMRELDLRYREYIPRGILVSLPLSTTKEIRRLWVSTELGKHHTSGTKFFIYPFANDVNTRVDIDPYRVGSTDAAEQTQAAEGQILHIVTSEEQTLGLADNLEKFLVVDPKPLVEVFEGTTREGSIRPGLPIHVRSHKIKELNQWLESYAIWPTQYDPNAATLFGADNTSAKDSIRLGTLTSGFDLSDIKSKSGYIPIKITIETDRWTAHPDTFGRPDRTRVRSVVGEILELANLSETTMKTTYESEGFETWLNTTTLSDLLNMLYEGRVDSSNLQQRLLGVGLGSLVLGNQGNVSREQLLTKTLREILEISSTVGGRLNNRNNLLYRVNHARLKGLYGRLKAQGKIKEEENSVTTSSASRQVDSVYATKFQPIITGPAGAFLRLWWYNQTTDEYRVISSADFEVVDPKMGMIRIHTLAPSGFDDVIADYNYLSYSETEDYFSAMFGYVTETTTGSISSFSGGARMGTRQYPVTRNMTDYTTGKVPELRPPDMDKTSRDYYPVIEYYVNSDGEIIFSRDFFKYGDQPARRIKIECETLGLAPRVAFQVTRSNSPTASPTGVSLSLRAMEKSGAPQSEL